MFDLPSHLQTLNALPSSTSPPSNAFNAEQEEAFWSLLNTDELFNFGVAPSAFESKSLEENKCAAAETMYQPANTPDMPNPLATAPAAAAAGLAPALPAGETKAVDNVQPTLEAFLATFVNEPTPSTLPNNYLLPLPAPFTPSASTSSAPTPTSTQNTQPVKVAEVKPSSALELSLVASGEDRITGTKRLKQMGAGPAEIEEENTEASARFRAKKKEREQALEQRAKELEQQVASLTAEKVSLEKENNLLKFIVVNGHGGASADSLQNVLASLGKRKRDE